MMMVANLLLYLCLSSLPLHELCTDSSTPSLSKRYSHDAFGSIKPLSIAITPAGSRGVLLLVPVESSEIMLAALLISIGAVWLNAPTTLWRRFEGLDNLISEPVSISTILVQTYSHLHAQHWILQYQL
jgi:hypothetical protein